MPKNFSDEEDEKLVHLVEQRPILFDVKNENYKNAQKRKDTWIEIGVEMGKAGKCYFRCDS